VPPGQTLKPVKQQISRGHAFWFWATAADIAQVETEPTGTLATTLGPIAAPVELPSAAPRDTEDDEDDESCHYGEHTFETWLSTDRESDAIIPVRRARPATGRVVLDWSDPAHMLPYRQPCQLCGNLTYLADEEGRPSHKVCAENVRSPYP
jgi:hypothetical protein